MKKHIALRKMLIRCLNVKGNINLQRLNRLNNKQRERKREKQKKYISIYIGLSVKYYPRIFLLFQSPFTLQFLYEYRITIT